MFWIVLELPQPTISCFIPLKSSVPGSSDEETTRKPEASINFASYKGSRRLDKR